MFDTHAHYSDRSFNKDRDELLNKLFASGITNIVEVGTNKKSSEEAKALAENYAGMYFAAGIHPESAETIDGCEQWLLPLIYSSKCVAIGEIGLDYHYEMPSKESKIKAFRRQLEIAEDADMPVCIHDRDAHGDVMEILEEYKKVTGIMHSFSGSPEMAMKLVNNGWYISFSGVITYSNAVRTVETAKAIPMDRILIETDCPYLTAVPHRGERNDSSFMRFTLQKIADLKGISFEEAEKITTENAFRAYRIEKNN